MDKSSYLMQEFFALKILFKSIWFNYACEFNWDGKLCIDNDIIMPTVIYNDIKVWLSLTYRGVIKIL